MKACALHNAKPSSARRGFVQPCKRKPAHLVFCQSSTAPIVLGTATDGKKKLVLKSSLFPLTEAQQTIASTSLQHQHSFGASEQKEVIHAQAWKSISHINPPVPDFLTINDTVVTTETDKRSSIIFHPGTTTADGERTEQLTVKAGAHMRPHLQKTATGGEDACYIDNRNLGVMGIADGVGGTLKAYGVDSGVYARELMKNLDVAVENANGLPMDALRLIDCIHTSTTVEGSSTVCIAVVKPGGMLNVANLGDSGLRVVRRGVVAFATKPQQHSFNAPYQMSHPSYGRNRMTLKHVGVYEFQLQPGDIVVLATDGLWDNLFDDQVALFAACHHGSQAELASLLTNAAHRVADSAIFTPWASLTQSQDGGGKMDDCCVVVGFVA